AHEGQWRVIDDPAGQGGGKGYDHPLCADAHPVAVYLNSCRVVGDPPHRSREDHRPAEILSDAQRPSLRATNDATLLGIAKQALECPRLALVPGGRDVEEDVEQRRFARLEAPDRIDYYPIQKLPRHLGLEVLI